MKRLFFITHADVLIDPKVPVPDWGLSPRGVARHQALARRALALGTVFASAERKAQDGAQILAQAHGLRVQTVAELGENDRSATGYLPKDLFEATADRFFAQPERSVDGWERAVDAQARIVAAVQHCVATAAPAGDVAIVAHGGVGALFLAWLQQKPISRGFDQPPGNGGFMLTVGLPDWQLIDGWSDIASLPATSRRGAIKALI